MAEQYNPYEAPKSDPRNLSGELTDFEIDGKYLVVRNNASLPGRCYKCNCGCGDRERVTNAKLYYVSKLVYLLLLINLLVLLIIYVIIRKKVQVSYSICKRHKRIKSNFGLAAFLSLILAPVCFIVGYNKDNNLIIATGGLFAVSFIVFLTLYGRGLFPAKHKEDRFWLSGISKEFLKQMEAGSAVTSI
jgi:hypothetical protein